MIYENKSMEINLDLKENIDVEVHGTHKYWIETNHGKLLDLSMGYTSFLHGFDDRDILKCIQNMQATVGFISGKKNETSIHNDTLVEKICSIGNFAGLTWAVSGTDGVEAALLMNNNYWSKVNPDKKIVISFTPGYHGATFMCRVLRGEIEIPDRVKTISLQPWSDIAKQSYNEQQAMTQLRNYLEKYHNCTGAIIMETIPWASGLMPWSDQWWPLIRSLCDEFDLNFILDDVFGGVGKLGHVFSNQRYNVSPDITVLGKSLTNGMSPLSCACAKEHIVKEIHQEWFSGHTWQPNMAGVAAATAVIDRFDSSIGYQIEKQLTQIGEHLKNLNLIKNYHVIGLLFSFTMTEPITYEKFIKNGLSNRPVMPDNSTFVCAPIIADREYFVELQNRLIDTLS
jgi:adenosylmethionine-8-amino-7-oxononanoate aminotransferase